MDLTDAALVLVDLQRGFDVVVVSDATATFDRTFDGERFDAETSHRVALAHLSGKFAEVATAADVLGALETVAA